MRAIALATAAAVLFTAASAAARTWNDPAGRVTFDAPASWVMDVRLADPQTIVLAGNADDECYVIATPNPNTETASAGAVRRSNTPLAQDVWERTANSITPMFPDGSAQMTAQSVDESGFWPIQRAEFSSPERPVTAAVTSRPGMDLMAFCWTYGSGDVTTRFNDMFASLGHSNDPAWRAAAEAEPVPAPAPVEPAPETE